MKQLITIFLLFIAMSFNIAAQEDLVYKLPSSSILQLAEYNRAPGVLMDTKKDYMVLTYRNTYKSLDDLNQEDLRLGGLRINPVTNIASNLSYVNNLKVRKIKDAKAEPTQVTGLPTNPKITNISWSYDDSKVAFTHTSSVAVELWVLDVAKAQANKITDVALNANVGSPFVWLKDNKTLLVRTLPADRSIVDAKKTLPTGPTTSNATGNVSQNRTYQDLLKNKTDEINFETLVTSEIYKIDLTGKKQLFLPKKMYIGQSISPDGKYVMMTNIEKPFSFIVPFTRFPQTSIVYDINGKIIRDVNDVPLVEVMAKGFSAVRMGKRSMGWRSDKPATLSYVESLDKGDPAVKVDYRDELFSWDAPFTSPAVSIAKTKQRFSGVTWGDETTAIIYDNWYDTRNVKTYLFNPSNPAQEPSIISDRNSQDVYSDPGNFEMKENQYGRMVLAKENNKMFLIGSGYSKEGEFPFIDEFDLASLKTKRLYQTKFTTKKEDILSLEDIKKGQALVMIQSKNEYPNYYFRNINSKDDLTQITFNKNPFESISNIHKEVIKYKREDGVELSGTLYLPAGYDKVKKEKLPLLIWAYPEEFKDKNSASQSTQNPNQFTFPNYGSFVYWVTKGYAVLDDASFPIIGEGETEPNDKFIEQLVANGKAAIDAVDNLGYIDRAKVAVGGHSYGAFMTANLLTHCDLFACGIARSGAYNRTLTPFGFQSEQRNYWDVPDVYNKMSPFMNANKMKKPILLIHGEADNNPGTFTLQTERYFQALKGLGANARMVILPKEAHGYEAKENIMHMLWEQEQFLDKYLKKSGA
jgi:dipeptidyl aminopeptidase/acylaminoacyl peptidase